MDAELRKTQDYPPDLDLGGGGGGSDLSLGAEGRVYVGHLLI